MPLERCTLGSVNRMTASNHRTEGKAVDGGSLGAVSWGVPAASTGTAVSRPRFDATLGSVKALALLLDDPSAPEEARVMRPPFEETVRAMASNIDSVLLCLERLLEIPPEEDGPPERSSALCDQLLTSLASTVQWFRFVATDAFKAA